MKKILVCNQKMFLTKDEAILLKEKMCNINFDNVHLVVCPNYLNYDIFNQYELGAQDAFYEDRGAYTGEVSAYDLSLRGIKYSLVGHSERRCYDTDDIINLKVKALLKNFITPIICIGDTKIDKELRKTSEVLKKQLTKALKDVDLDYQKEVWIAYEPRFLIGGKNALSENEIEDIMNYIKKVLKSINIENYKLLYGGSVSSDNITSLLNSKVDGFLLGSSSVDFDMLKKIVMCIK